MQKRQLEKISNSYYNLGLSFAGERNLGSAVYSLQKALEYNKNNINARNLLGLVYYEIGEIASALATWVISINLKKDDNIADFYIYEVQKDAEKMSIYADLIKRYNDALVSVNSFNKDLAILGLVKVVDANPRYIKAALLLALLHIEKAEYIKADRILDRVLKIDKYNHLALKYKSFIKENTPKASHINISSTDVIIPETYKNYTGLQTVVNIAIGLLIGAAFIMFLYIPTMKARLNHRYNMELATISEKLNEANISKNEISSKLDEVINERDRLKEASNTSAENINYRSTQYQKLVAMQEAFAANDFTRVADLYSDFDASVIVNIDDGSSFDITSVINTIKTRVDTDGYILLLNHANDLANAGDYEKAIIYYDRSIKLHPDNAMSILKKGEALVKLGRNEEAISLFSDVIINYPDSAEANEARIARGY